MNVKLATISIEMIDEGDRSREDYGDLTVLVESIRNKGLIHPIAVHEEQTELGEYMYTLLAGGRRLRACRMLSIKNIPVRIYEGEMSNFERTVIELEENIRRKDLDWVESAKITKKIHDLYIEEYGEKVSKDPDAPGHTKLATADLLGRSPTSVKDDLRLAEAVEMMPELETCKTKDEADKLLKTMTRRVEMGQVAENIKELHAKTPIDKARKSLTECYMVGDFFKNADKIEDSSVDFIDLDPPYGMKLDKWKKLDGQRLEVAEYNEMNEAEYTDLLYKMIAICYDKLAPNGWMVMWFATQWNSEIFNILNRVGFRAWHIPAIWTKPSGQVNNPDLHLASCYEPFFYAAKGHGTIVKQGRSNVFQFNPIAPQHKVHPTEKPVELMEEIIQTFTKVEGIRCMVPFLGGGNTMLACSNLAIPVFGYDLSEVYKNEFTNKVFSGEPGKYRSYT